MRRAGIAWSRRFPSTLDSLTVPAWYSRIAAPDPLVMCRGSLIWKELKVRSIILMEADPGDVVAAKLNSASNSGHAIVITPVSAHTRFRGLLCHCRDGRPTAAQGWPRG